MAASVIEYQSTTRGSVADSFSLKRELSHLRRQIAPEHDAMAVLARRELPIVGEATGVYFQDHYEHVLCVTDAVDVYRELPSGVLDSYLSVNANNLAVAANDLNGIMKKLTAYSITLMGMALVTGISGMNFDNMPERHFSSGYPAALVLMVAVGFGLASFFKRQDWR